MIRGEKANQNSTISDFEYRSFIVTFTIKIHISDNNILGENYNTSLTTAINKYLLFLRCLYCGRHFLR